MVFVGLILFSATLGILNIVGINLKEGKNMTLTKWKPLNGITRLFDEELPLLRWRPFRDMDRFFDEDFTALALPKFGWDLAVDIYEKDSNIVAEMNIPGIDPEKVEIAIEDNYLKVSGSREEKKETEEKDYYSKEIKRGSFTRTVALPVSVKKEKAEAEYKDGILKILIPKDEKKDNTIKVKVKK